MVCYIGRLEREGGRVGLLYNSELVERKSDRREEETRDGEGKRGGGESH
jgi:hypothetical protein